jgi:hypothetical protein
VKYTQAQIKQEMEWHLGEKPKLNSRELDFIIRMCEVAYQRGVVQGRKDMPTQASDAPVIKPESKV